MLTGGSGSMGFQTFKLLWEMRDLYDIVLLLLPAAQEKKLFRGYEMQAGIAPTEGAGVVSGDGLKIVWGDALNREDMIAACQGIDCCLHVMALISPEADRNPEMAEKVNTRATQYLVEAIEAQDPDHIRLISVGTVAEYGSRLSPVHVGRTGDPVIPSVYDHYAVTKIRGELAVMQSRIKHRVSLRQTFIMVPDPFSLRDPIMFHQPIHSFMENITVLDAGRLMINSLEVPEESDFWGGYYNISGGPACRTTYLEFLHRIYTLLGIRYEKVMERRWFALKNFHMQFYSDAERLNGFLHHWDGGQTMEDYYREVWKTLPWYLRMTSWHVKNLPLFRLIVEAATRKQLKKLACREEGTIYWVENNDTGRINAFYGSLEAYRSIPGWDQLMLSMDPALDHHQKHIRLNHGYDETKKELELKDLQQAAIYRSGQLVSKEWNGNMHLPLTWKCYQKHTFKMTPHAVLKGGHWCLECISPPWDYHALVDQNRFAAQVLKPSMK